MKIGVIGSGISGLSAALFLQSKHEVTLYEKNDYLGGHANTINVNIKDKNYNVETGFIVLNDHNYPNFIELLKYLNIKTNVSSMSFSVSADQGNFEYSSSYVGLLSQSKNIIDPLYWSMLRDINYFYNNATKDASQGPENETLGDFLKRCNYSERFINYHIIPMAASIWSCPKKQIVNFPIKNLLNFFKNHKLLNLFDRPNWKTVVGGSQNYVRAISEKLSGPIHKGVKVKSIVKSDKGVRIYSDKGYKSFDCIVLACQANESYTLLRKNFPEHEAIFKNFSYQKNISIVHSDINYMPQRKSVWSSWNYIVNPENTQNLSITYWMNKLQNIESSQPIFVSLNPHKLPNPELIYSQHSYFHPVFDNNAVNIQKNLKKIQGQNNIWFCGAWTGYGFHEDGILSAINLAKTFDCFPPWLKKEKTEILYAAQ